MAELSELPATTWKRRASDHNRESDPIPNSSLLCYTVHRQDQLAGSIRKSSSRPGPMTFYDTFRSPGHGSVLLWIPGDQC
jgi:hypothetical protein